MRLLVESLADPASTNIADRLRELVDWQELGLFNGRRILAHEELRLITIDGIHIEHENLQDHLPPSLTDPEVAIFLSRHASKSGRPSLSVHPIGNWNQAPYGGQEGTVIPTAPYLMAGLFKGLDARETDGFEVTYEATHHGPYLPYPTLFYELGSTEDEWADEDAARVLAEVLLDAETMEAPTVLWVGGGHYCPQVNDLVRAGKIAPGHIIPNWATNEEITDATLEQAIEGIPDLSGFMVQRNPTSDERKLGERLAGMGLEELEPDAL